MNSPTTTPLGNVNASKPETVGAVDGVMFAVSNDGGKTGVAWRENVFDALAYLALQNVNGGDYAVVAVRKTAPTSGAPNPDGCVEGVMFAVSSDGGKTGVAWRENVFDALAYLDIQNVNGGNYAVVAVRKTQNWGEVVGLMDAGSKVDGGATKEPHRASFRRHQRGCAAVSGRPVYGWNVRCSCGWVANTNENKGFVEKLFRKHLKTSPVS